MNAVDLVILTIFAAGLLYGLRQGFILEIALILGAVVALAVARVETPVVRHFVLLLLPKSPWITFLTYLLLFVLVWTIIIVLARRLRFLAHLLLLGWADRLGGAVIGLLQAAVLIELLLSLGHGVHDHTLHQAIVHSRLAPVFLHTMPYLNHLLPHGHLALSIP